ncbi:MAG: thiamine ABC transporter substrate binding subunit [Arachnia sp.]
MHIRSVVVALAALTATACTATGASTPPGATGQATTELTVVTHESFQLSDELKAQFEADTGYQVTYVAPGDAGTLVNQLVLTKDAPLGDVAFGIDTTYAGRAQAEGVFAPYTSPALPKQAAGFVTDGLTPIDHGQVCVNADTAWFDAAGIDVPDTLDDLTQPQYQDLLVVINPASSSPGLAFLLATIAVKGTDGYLDYWQELVDNGARVATSWTDAYYGEFSGTEGQRPLVVSYATSPAYTVTHDAASSTTTALLETCYQQVEYAGVLDGAANPAGAEAFIDFMLSDAVQASIPEAMYMYPVAPVELPETWTQFAPLSTDAYELAPADVDQHRAEWIEAWTGQVIG